jgi:hypothetical protein
MVAPPLVILGSIFRPSLTRPFSIKRILNSVIKWTVIGAGVGGAAGWGKMRNEPETAILDRVERLVGRHFTRDRQAGHTYTFSRIERNGVMLTD